MVEAVWIAHIHKYKDIKVFSVSHQEVGLLQICSILSSITLKGFSYSLQGITKYSQDANHFDFGI